MSHRRLGLVVAALGASALAACATPAPEARCIGRAAEAIVGGTPDAEHVGLSDAEASAIGALEDQYGTVYCTGFVVDSKWILTAKHSGAMNGLRFRPAGRAGDSATIALGEAISHGEADLALLRIDAPAALEAMGIAPLDLRQ